jgi:alanine racemase
MSLLAHISHGALRANLAGAAVAGSVVDVRADAWGHGAIAVAAAALAAGATAVIADERDREPLAAAGITGGRVRFHGAPTVDPRRIYGLAEQSTPVMRLSGSVLSTKRLLAGEGVSYGYLYRAPTDTHVALVSGGYAQGIVRAVGGAASILLGGSRCPIRGRVAMDVCVVEIGTEDVGAMDIGAVDVERGDDAWFFGDPATGAPAVAEWTAATGMTAAEIVTAIGLHSPREYVA